jgi:putative ABC transport system permease protein
MNWRKWRHRLPLSWRETVRRKKTEQELDEELAFHVEMQAAANQSRGMNEDEARYAALRQFDGLEQRKEECRDARKMNRMDELVGDMTYALRMLRKRPAFTAIAVLSLAIGIGASTALFSVVDAVVLHPVPLAEADRLVSIDEFKDGKPSNGNPPRTYDWGAFTPAFESVTGFYGEDLVLTGQGEPVRVSALRTCGDPLRTLHIEPAQGRGFTAAEQKGQGGPVALISDEAWRQRFGSDAAIRGRTLTLSGKSYTIIGVLPRGVSYPSDADVWLPIPPENQQETSRGAGFLNTVARLKAGVRGEEVQAQLQVVASQLARQYPATDKDRSARAVSLNEFETRESRGPLLILWGTALLVLLLACVNFASLLLSRSFTRQREASIRMALGAGAVRLARLYLSESILIALLGGAFGLAAATLTLNFLVSLLPATLPNLVSVSLNPRAIGLAAAMSLLCGVLAGWVPAWRMAGSASKRGSARQGGLFYKTLPVVAEGAARGPGGAFGHRADGRRAVNAVTGENCFGAARVPARERGDCER